jgi:hypothetical protein
MRRGKAHDICEHEITVSAEGETRDSRASAPSASSLSRGALL